MISRLRGGGGATYNERGSCPVHRRLQPTSAKCRRWRSPPKTACTLVKGPTERSEGGMYLEQVHLFLPWLGRGVNWGLCYLGVGILESFFLTASPAAAPGQGRGESQRCR